MSYLEIGMLLCFAASWPVSIVKTLRTRTVEGKSVAFLYIIILGYSFGIAHKLQHNHDWVTWLYAFNAGLVAVDVAVWHRFRVPAAAALQPARPRRWLAAAGGGLLLALLAIPALHRLLPGSFIFAALTNFRLQLGGLALLAALLLLLARRHVFALVAMLPALWWLGNVFAYSLPATPAARAAPTALNLLYANVNTANREPARLLRLIDERQPDLIGLLEQDDNWRDALQTLTVSHPHRVAEYRADNFGLALYSRLPFTDTDMLRSPEVGLGTIRARLVWQGQNVTIFLAHPLPPSSDDQLTLRDTHLRWLADAAAAETTPVIIMGDFNATDGTGIFSEVLARSGLKDSRAGFGWQPSWPEPMGEARQLPLAPLWPYLLRIPLDHVLVPPGWTVLDRSVGPPIGSDHLPVQVLLAHAPRPLR